MVASHILPSNVWMHSLLFHFNLVLRILKLIINGIVVSLWRPNIWTGKFFNWPLFYRTLKEQDPVTILQKTDWTHYSRFLVMWRYYGDDLQSCIGSSGLVWSRKALNVINKTHTQSIAIFQYEAIFGMVTTNTQKPKLVLEQACSTEKAIFCKEKLIARVVELGSLSSGAKMAMKISVKRVFTIFASNASFLRVIANLQN